MQAATKVNAKLRPVKRPDVFDDISNTTQTGTLYAHEANALCHVLEAHSNYYQQ